VIQASTWVLTRAWVGLQATIVLGQELTWDENPFFAILKLLKAVLFFFSAIYVGVNTATWKGKI
jgi:hypothetical protein